MTRFRDKLRNLNIPFCALLFAWMVIALAVVLYLVAGWLA